MADQKNRGGQKKGGLDSKQSEQHQGANTQGTGKRSKDGKQQDMKSNPDDSRREPTDSDQQR